MWDKSCWLTMSCCLAYRIYIIKEWEMEKKILKAVLEDELVDGVEIKKWEKHEFESLMADYLLNAYGNRRELCSSEEKEEKAEKKVSKKK